MATGLTVHRPPSYSSIRTLPKRLDLLARRFFGRPVTLFQTEGRTITGLTKDGRAFLEYALRVLEG